MIKLSNVNSGNYFPHKKKEDNAKTYGKWWISVSALLSN
jgi:hypothetical protein